jgi:hypothetical protein
MGNVYVLLQKLFLLGLLGGRQEGFTLRKEREGSILRNRGAEIERERA